MMAKTHGEDARSGTRAAPGAGEEGGAPLDPSLLAAAMGAVTCGVTVSDASQPGLPLIYANDAFLSLTGYPRQEVIGRSCRFLQGAGTDPEVVQRIRDDIAARRDGTYRLLNYRRSGESFWNELRLVRVPGGAGRPDYLVGTQTDISQDLLEQESHEKFERLGMLAAGMAHEINTPSQYISDNLYFIQESVTELLASVGGAAHGAGDADLAFLRAELPQAIAQCQQGVVQIGKIVAAVRAFAYRGEGAKQAADIGDLVAQALTMTRGQWKYLARATVTPDSDAAVAECAASEILQVVVNLIINAAHAIEDAGRNAEGRIEIAIRQQADNVAISVADNGSGIPAARLAHVFDPHYTSKRQGRGTGLGLSICRRIVEEGHGGTIAVSSRDGVGTTVTVTLPLDGR